MDIIHSVIYGIVEGITEFLPISSTGHLILTSKILGNTQTDFLKTFEIAIQFGAILSVVAIYFKELFVNTRIAKRVIAAFIPTGILGLIFYPVVKNLLGSEAVVLWSLFLGGIAIILFEKFYGERKDATMELADITYRQAISVGLFQSIAMVPGVSRAAATILGGMFVGLGRKTIVQFSFLLAVPTMFAATVFDVFKNFSSFSVSEFDFLIVGFIVSFVVAFLSIKLLLKFVKTHTFTSFGIYRILVAILFFIFVM